MSREAIRQSFSDAIATVYSGPVYTTRITDNRDDAEYFSIYIESGEVFHSSSGKSYESNITVRFCKQRATDDQLDQLSEVIVSAIESNPGVRALVRIPLLVGFEYEPDGTHNGLNHTFRIAY